MIAGVDPQRYLDGFTWDEFKWRRGELEAQFKGMTVLAGVDDMDSFKGIELKLQVCEHVQGWLNVKAKCAWQCGPTSSIIEEEQVSPPLPLALSGWKRVGCVSLPRTTNIDRSGGKCALHASAARAL